jgi:2-C-methyl-D-erythritol 4-phosphate cytidylyltransferase
MGKLGVVIVAGGKGTRMKTSDSKQYLPLGDRPIVVHTIQVFEHIPEVAEIILVVGEHDITRNQDYVNKYQLSKVKRIVTGGYQRQQSVSLGLDALSSEVEWVLVHDGVRPFVTADQVRACWHKAMDCDAAVLAVPVKDTIKIANEDGYIISTPPRNSLWTIQTPQAFRLSLLQQAHREATLDHFLGTDDAMLIERMDKQVAIVEGDYYNIKMTTPEDMVWAAWILGHVRGEKTQ